MALTKVTGQVIKDTTDVTVGVLTVTNTLAVGGTVSIGGTLTYEDVTNVDAVGLITARDGIVVGSGITLSVDGDIFATGVTTVATLKVTTGIVTTLTATTGIVTTLTANTVTSLGAVSGTTGTFSGAVSGTTGTFSDDVNITGGSGRLNISSSVNGVGILSSTDSNATLDLYDNAAQTRFRTIEGRCHISADHRNAVADSSIRFLVDGVNQASIDGNGHIFFSGDDDTYFYRPDANRFAFVTGGTERLRIDNAGRIGIGTSDPNNILHLFADGGSNIIEMQRISTNTTGNVGAINFTASDGHSLASIGAYGDGDNEGAYINFKTTSAASSNNPFTSTTEALRIASDGRSTFYNDLTIDTTALATTANLTIKGGEASQAQINLIADDGDDATDNWRIAAMSGYSNRLIFYNGATGSQTDILSFKTDGSIRPGVNNQASLGEDTLRWANVYTNDLHLSNQGSTNNVDNTWGDYTIQEGESDLFLINNRSGKKYKFNLTEVS